jgi:CheY-like chemotaxis protein
MTVQDTLPVHILVVDDDPLVAALLADVLADDGWVVDLAKNGREALEKIAGRSYNLIMSDLRMPELDGMALYQELRKRHPTLLERFVFVSGSTEMPEYTSFLGKTHVPVLNKPFDIEALLQLVHRMV